MKICVVIPSFFPATVFGGTIFSTLNACKVLAIRGHEVNVSTTNSNKYSKLDVVKNKFVEFDNFKVKYYDETVVDRFSFALLFNLWKDIRHAEVVHIQAIFNTPTPIALFYSWLFNKPVVLSPRGVLGEWILRHGLPLKKTWIQLFIKPFSNIIKWHATSNHEKKEIIALFPKADISVIPNGINFEEYHNIQRLSKKEFMSKFTGTASDPSHIVVSLGRLHKKKGFDILIDSFLLLKEHSPLAVLVIAGEDEGELGRLTSKIKSSPYPNDIFIIPFIDKIDKVSFLANADVFALPSHNENFGNVYAESLASGTPIVASLYTPWSEVSDAGCGKWVENTPHAFLGAMKELLTADREELRKNSLKFISGYSWSSVAEKFENCFSDIIHTKSK